LLTEKKGGENNEEGKTVNLAQRALKKKRKSDSAPALK